MIRLMWVAASLVILFFLFVDSPFTPSDPPDKNKAFAASVIAEVKQSNKWRRVEVWTATDKQYSFAVDYAVPPDSYSEVERDTKTIARAMLAALVADREDPASEGITVFVSGIMSGIKGETGKNMTMDYGQTIYEYNDDKLVFTPPK